SARSHMNQASVPFQPLVEELRANVAAREMQLGRLQGEMLRQTEQSADRFRDHIMEAEKKNSDLNAQVTFLQERLAAERAEREKIHEKFRTEFEAISNRLLMENSSRFTQQSSDNLEKVLGPLREN